MKQNPTDVSEHAPESDFKKKEAFCPESKKKKCTHMLEFLLEFIRWNICM